MAKKKRGDAHGGGHGWFVTFADLMGLMMSFFVMLIAFSTMDNNKLKVVAGSMRDAFGVQTSALFRHHRIRRLADAGEAEERRAYRAGGNIQHADAGRAGAQPAQRRPAKDRSRVRAGLGFAAAGAAGHAGTDRNLQAHHVRGDQGGPQSGDRRPGRPLDVRRRLQGALRPHPPADREARVPLKATPLRVSIVGHTAAGFVPARSDYGAFDLSADRANAVRQILEREGCPRGTSSRCPERPTPSRCFRTIPRWRQIGA